MQVGTSRAGLAKLSPIQLNQSHTSLTKELAQLASHHCFQIEWCSPAGKLYYDEDRIAFVEDADGKVNTALLLALSIDVHPLVCTKLRQPLREQT